MLASKELRVVSSRMEDVEQLARNRLYLRCVGDGPERNGEDVHSARGDKR
jgi:hypothetical protein